jgi:small subunit ribosomal protein S11
LPKQIRKKNLLQRKFSLFQKKKQKLIRKRKDCIEKISRWFIEQKPGIGSNQQLYAKVAFFARRTNCHTQLEDWLLLQKLFSQKVIHKYDQLKTSKKLCEYLKLFEIYKKLYTNKGQQLTKGTATLAQAYERTIHFVQMRSPTPLLASPQPKRPFYTKSRSMSLESLPTLNSSQLLKLFQTGKEAKNLSDKLSKAKADRRQVYKILRERQIGTEAAATFKQTIFPFLSDCTPSYPHFIPEGRAKQIEEILSFTLFWEKKFFHDLSKKEQAIFSFSLEKKQEKWKRARARKLRKQIKQIKKRIGRKMPRGFPIPKKYRKHYLAVKKHLPKEQLLKVKKHKQFPKRLSKPLPIIFIQASINNTFLTLTDTKGNTLYATSAGKVGLKNARKSGRLVSQSVAIDLGRKCRFLRVRQVDIRIRGIGGAKRTALTALRRIGLRVRYLTSYFEHPFNGCRSPKKRRV